MTRRRRYQLDAGRRLLAGEQSVRRDGSARGHRPVVVAARRAPAGGRRQDPTCRSHCAVVLASWSCKTALLASLATAPASAWGEFAKLSSDSMTGNEKKLQCCRSRTEVRPTALPSSPTLQAVTPTRYLDGQSPTSCCNDPGTCPCRWSPRSPRPGARRSSRCPEAHLPPPALATPVVPRGPDRRGAAGSAWVATRRTPSTAAGHPTASSPCRVMQQNSVNFTLSTLSYIILKIYSAPITKWT